MVKNLVLRDFVFIILIISVDKSFFVFRLSKCFIFLILEKRLVKICFKDVFKEVWWFEIKFW